MTDTVNTRELVLGIMMEVTKDQEYSHIAIRNVLDKYQYLPKQDRKFITRIAEGTIENMIQLDYIINQFSKVKVNKMKPVIRNILRMSVYQLKYMDSIPSSAACNEAVKLAQKKGFVNLKGFVNGVLRNISRNLEQIQYPDPVKEEIAYLSVTYSMPQWMIQQWRHVYDKDTVEQMLQSFLKESPTTVRTNLAKITPEELMEELKKQEITVVQDEELPYCLYLSNYDSIARIEAFQKGLFYIQDKSSMKVAEAADPKEGDYCIDVCAAPGGKSMHLAEKLMGSGHVEARDLTEYKVSLIQENKERCQMENVSTKMWDATIYDESCKEKADVLICDLPCSGLGVLSRKSDIKYKVTEKAQEELAKLQQQILSTVWSYVKPGGRLIYSTCTIDKQENEDNVEWFLREHKEFELEKMEQILPGTDGNDGFFIARIKRQETGQ